MHHAATATSLLSGRDRSLFVRRLVGALSLLLLAPCAMASTAAGATRGQEETQEVKARIALVEQTLLTPVVVKDAPIQAMRLSERMAFHDVPAVSIAVINNGRVG